MHYCLCLLDLDILWSICLFDLDILCVKEFSYVQRKFMLVVLCIL